MAGTDDTREMNRLLLREGALQQRLRHPNVLALVEVVEVDGLPGLVLEYVEGPDLADYLAAHRPGPARIDALAREHAAPAWSTETSSPPTSSSPRRPAAPCPRSQTSASPGCSRAKRTPAGGCA